MRIEQQEINTKVREITDMYCDLSDSQLQGIKEVFTLVRSRIVLNTTREEILEALEIIFTKVLNMVLGFN